MFGNNDHSMTEHEFNRSVAGWLGAMALASWMRHWGIRIKPWVYYWVVLLGLVPIIGLLILSSNADADPSSPYGSPPEWVSAAIMWIGGLEILLIIAGLICLWVDWRRQQWATWARYQQALVEQQDAANMALVEEGMAKVRYDHAVAKVTGQAVAEALRNQRPPEEPTGPSQRPPAPTPPSPPAPMGSTTPTLWVPTFHGPRKALQRRQETLGGIWMNDHRGVDPDDL